VKGFIVNEPVAIVSSNNGSLSSFKPNIFTSNTISSIAVQRPVNLKDEKKNKKNEIFVDIFEKISVYSLIFHILSKKFILKLDSFQCFWLCDKLFN